MSVYFVYLETGVPIENPNRDLPKETAKEHAARQMVEYLQRYLSGDKDAAEFLVEEEE